MSTRRVPITAQDLPAPQNVPAGAPTDTPTAAAEHPPAAPPPPDEPHTPADVPEPVPPRKSRSASS